jgi:acyl carrier protein
MKREKIKEVLIKTLKLTDFGVTSIVIDEQSTLGHIGLDSIEVIDFALKIEIQLNIGIPDSEIETWKNGKTIGEILDYLTEITAPKI